MVASPVHQDNLYAPYALNLVTEHRVFDLRLQILTTVIPTHQEVIMWIFHLELLFTVHLTLQWYYFHTFPLVFEHANLYI